MASSLRRKSAHYSPFAKGNAVNPGLMSVPCFLLKASICAFVTAADSGSMLLTVVSLNDNTAIESGGCFCLCGGAGKPSSFGTAMRVRHEESVLRATFADYDAYAARVKRFVPGLF